VKREEFGPDHGQSRPAHGCGRRKTDWRIVLPEYRLLAQQEHHSQRESGTAGAAMRGVWSHDVFYESPEDVHTVSRNASNTKPAKFVVFFIKNEGAPILTPVR